jgi:predicted ATPase
LCANELLLILDNCEHLVEPCARLAEALLRSAPGLRILATSREALGIPGEAVWPTPPLQLPEATTPAELLSACDALRLFGERAAAACPGFQLDRETAPVVGGMCRRLDALPLAIELAAARVRILPLAELAVRLEDRFSLLTGGGRTTVPRQRTLRATVEWSYGLLGERERLLFDRLSVFCGGWSLEAAEVVCSGDGIDPGEVLDLLTRLVEQSMVEVASGGGRFRMLETLRGYATARLEESGQAAAVHRRHLGYYLALADRPDPHVPGSQHWKYRELAPDGDNLRAALTWALDNGDTDSALGLGACLGFYWFFGNQEEGRRWLSRLLEAAPDARTPQRARALGAYGLVQAFHRTDEAGRAGREALSIHEELGDRWAGATAKLLIVLDLLERGHLPQATGLLEEAEAVFGAVDDRRGEAIVWWLRSTVGLQAGDVTLAVEAGKQSLERFRTLEDAWGTASVLENLAELAQRRGDYREAVAMYQESLALARSGGLAYAEQDDLVRLGTVLLLLGEQDRAQAQSRRAWRWPTASAIASAHPWPTTGWACWPGNAATWTWPANTTSRPSRFSGRAAAAPGWAGWPPWRNRCAALDGASSCRARWPWPNAATRRRWRRPGSMARPSRLRAASRAWPGWPPQPATPSKPPGCWERPPPSGIGSACRCQNPSAPTSS